MYFYGRTDIGKKRETNQDNYLTVRLSDNVLICVLCDGMGGTVGGNIASGLAGRAFIDTLEARLSPYINSSDEDDGDNWNIASEASICTLPDDVSPTSFLREAVVAANTAVYNRARENSDLANMGTTIVAAMIIGNRLYTLNVGDSRMYRIADRSITQLTHDHSYVQMLVDMGKLTKAEAAVNPRKNILTRAVGIDETVDADITSTDIGKANSFLLLCSDGLYNFLDENEMRKIVARRVKKDDDEHDLELSGKIDELVDTANENGGGDNITAILIKFVK